MDDEDAMPDALEDVEDAEADVRLAETLGGDVAGPLAALGKALLKVEELEKARRLKLGTGDALRSRYSP